MRYLTLCLLLLTTTSLFAQPVRNNSKKSNDEEYRHSLSFTPFSGIVAYGNINPGIGFDYEYMISPEHGIGVHIPFAFGYAGPEQDFYDEYRHTTAYAAPGIRFHSGQSGSNIDFATGPSVLFGNMHFSPTDNYNNPAILREPYDYNMLGFVVDNSLNFYRRHFQFGFDVRVGTMLDVQEDSRFFLHFGMHFGGRF